MLFYTSQINAVRQSVSRHFTFPRIASGTIQITLSRVTTYVDDPGGFHFGVAKIVTVVSGGKQISLPSTCSNVIVGDTTEAQAFVHAMGSGLSSVFNIFVDEMEGQKARVRKRDVHAPGLVGDSADVKIVVIYDAYTGKISAKHIVGAFEGGRAVSEEEAVDTAQRNAKRAGFDVTQLKSKISTNIEHAFPDYQIDPRTEEFVAVPIPGFERE